jgi:hypothetical protein
VTRRALVAAVLLVSAGATMGCSPDAPPVLSTPKPSATVSVTPSLDPAEVQKQAAVDAATTTLTALIAASNEIGLGGYADSAPISGLVGGDLRVAMLDLNRQSAESSSRQVGSASVADVTVAEYDAGQVGGGRERVVLDACIDTTGMDIVLPDGSSRLDPNTPDRRIVQYTVQNTDGHWTVDALTSDAARTC